MPPKDSVPVVADEEDDSYTRDEVTRPKQKSGKTENPNYGVGGTAKDGGLSTADTVADGGPDDEEKESSYKPS